MKNVNPILLLLLVAFWSKCQLKDQQSPTPKFTWEQVQAIAAEYGIQDSIKQDKSSILIYLKEVDLRNLLEQKASFYDYDKKVAEALRNIQCLDEYWVMLDSFPREKSMHFKTDSELLAEKKEWMDPGCEVYINKSKQFPYFTVIKKTDGDWEAGPNDRLLPKHCK